MRIDFYTSEPLRPGALDVIRAAKQAVFGDRPVRLNPTDKSAALHLDNGFLIEYPLAQTVLERRFAAYKRHPFGPETLYLDIESHSVNYRWSMTPRGYFRLGQYAIGDGGVILTTDYDEVIDLIEAAPGVVAHNGHPFDLSVLYGKDSIRPLELARDGRVFDTKVHAGLALPAPYSYVDRKGRRHKNANKPGKAEQWLSLDNLCFQLGLDGKEGDLKALAAKYAKEFGCTVEEAFGRIPLDDPEFMAYADQDVEALRELTGALLELYYPDDYAWREQTFAGINAQISRNGFTVDVAAAQARADFFAENKERILSRLQDEYGFPTEGVQPWKSNKGKEAIMAILADNGITPESHPDWTKTSTGNLSLGGEVLVELTRGTPAEDLGSGLAELMGQRSLPELALASVQPDGKVHPEISALQRSGRCSTTKPGLTVWGNNDDSDKGGIDRSLDKAYFIASPGRKLVEFDYSNADQRVLAGYSGDVEYLRRFDEGVDGHEINGRIMFTDEVYDTDPKHYRNEAKAPGHAFTYGAGAPKLAATTGLPIETMQRFVDGMNEKYPALATWTRSVREQAAGGYITNWWGRRMIVDRGRQHSQAPALMGQSGTREIVVDALIRMLRFDIRLITWVVAQVHDALVFDIPDEHLGWAVPKIGELMHTVWGPLQPVEFTVGVGTPAHDWKLASH